MIFLCATVLKYNWYFASTVDTESLVLKHQGISSYSTDYEPTNFQCPFLLTWINFNPSMDK